jgi:hypothetical protein
MTRTVMAKIAAHEKWAKLDPTGRRAATSAARKAAEDRFVDQARQQHPDANEAHIAKVVANLKSAHYRRLAMLSAKSRRKSAKA